MCTKANLNRYERRYDWFGVEYYSPETSFTAPKGIDASERNVADEAVADFVCASLTAENDAIRDALTNALQRSKSQGVDTVSRDVANVAKFAGALERGFCGGDAGLRCPSPPSSSSPSDRPPHWRRRVAYRCLPYFIVAFFAPVLALPSLFPVRETDLDRKFPARRKVPPRPT